MKRMSAPARSRFREPSKYIFQCSGFSASGGFLGLCPFRDEISKDLGLDGLPWAELKVEFTLLDRPLDDVPHGLDLVRLKVIPQLARYDEESI
jgi:hypothetical protein